VFDEMTFYVKKKEVINMKDVFEQYFIPVEMKDEKGNTLLNNGA
jgi:hypothetical protein